MRPMMFALVSAAFGQADQAFDYLEAAYAQRDPQLRLLRVHPTLRLLAEDRRYTALVERVRLLS
jgi:hypothetical protein